jgi:hypothetical protein
LKRGGTLIVKERSVPSAKKAKFTALIQLVKCWLYSWMQHGFFETEDEHHISSFVFFSFTESQHSQDFTSRHIFSHEITFSWCHQNRCPKLDKDEEHCKMNESSLRKKKTSNSNMTPNNAGE